MSDSLITRLEKLRDARLVAKEKPDEEITLLEMAIDALGDVKIEKVEAIVQPRPVGHPLTVEGVLAWAEEESTRQNELCEGTDGVSGHDVLVKVLADKFASDYVEWDKDELANLVITWDLNGCTGWTQYPLEELAQTVIEEMTEYNTMCDQPVVDVEGAIDVLRHGGGS
jgi:hypothetical protein